LSPKAQKARYARYQKRRAKEKAGTLFRLGWWPDSPDYRFGTVLERVLNWPPALEDLKTALEQPEMPKLPDGFWHLHKALEERTGRLTPDELRELRRGSAEPGLRRKVRDRHRRRKKALEEPETMRLLDEYRRGQRMVAKWMAEQSTLDEFRRCRPDDDMVGQVLLAAHFLRQVAEGYLAGKGSLLLSSSGRVSLLRPDEKTEAGASALQRLYEDAGVSGFVGLHFGAEEETLHHVGTKQTEELRTCYIASGPEHTGDKVGLGAFPAIAAEELYRVLTSARLTLARCSAPISPTQRMDYQGELRTEDSPNCDRFFVIRHKNQMYCGHRCAQRASEADLKPH